ncbi:DUF2089 domain-containing protein, partial [Eubacteriales bacterium OttesenSCG-928-M02]|nr:DUF2089 domain-containing protein [Eubacteriales bacterium OttesenSCG-928-M02]
VCRLHCPNCATEVSGNFLLDRFSTLTEEQMFFLETFIRLRGSLKDVGAALDISYPTARNRLDQLLTALGYGDTGTSEVERLDVLEQVKDGSISVADAIELLEGEK